MTQCGGLYATAKGPILLYGAWNRRLLNGLVARPIYLDVGRAGHTKRVLLRRRLVRQWRGIRLGCFSLPGIMRGTR